MMLVQDVITTLKEIKQDTAVNKSIKEKFERIILFLQKDPELGKDKALVEIEEMLAKNDIQPYLRAQIYNIVSMIESM